MIIDIKTAAEAKADALIWQQIQSAPNGIGNKVHALLMRLADFQRNNPTALFISVPAGEIIIPTAAINTIQTTWGYLITSQSTPKPTNYKGAINSWSTITRISWE